jgi:hypothetical protein
MSLRQPPHPVVGDDVPGHGDQRGCVDGFAVPDRVLVKGDQQRIWAYHDGVDLGAPAMARIARDYGYTLAGLRKL